jgi:hypothetical protein
MLAEGHEALVFNLWSASRLAATSDVARVSLATLTWLGTHPLSPQALGRKTLVSRDLRHRAN